MTQQLECAREMTPQERADYRAAQKVRIKAEASALAKQLGDLNRGQESPSGGSYARSSQNPACDGP